MKHTDVLHSPWPTRDHAAGVAHDRLVLGIAEQADLDEYKAYLIGLRLAGTISEDELKGYVVAAEWAATHPNP